MSLALPLILLASFGVSLAAGIMSQTTSTENNALIVSGQQGNGILETAGAETFVPLALTPLLAAADVGRINMLGISNFAEKNSNGDDDPCQSCPTNVVMQGGPH